MNIVEWILKAVRWIARGVFVALLLGFIINLIKPESQIDIKPKIDVIYKPIFTTDTVKINGRAYLRLNTEEDTTYSHYDKDGSDEIVWYERIELRSDLKPVWSQNNRTGLW